MPLEKALITNTVTQEKIPVMFNPEEYTISRDNNFAQIAVPGLRAPLLQFINGNMQTLDMELFLDTYEAHEASGRRLNNARDDVRKLTSKVTDLMNIDSTTHAPPPLVFTWASLSFTCVLAKVSQRFIMFLPDSTPVRARLQVSFHEYTNVDMEAKEIKRETVDYSQFYVVGQNETLSSIAARVYQNPALWRPIALRNRIDEPRTLETGQQLLIPKLPFRDPETGEVMQ